MHTDVVVIGAGLTGLATAFNVKKSGKQCLVLEKSNRAGGVIQTQQKEGFLYEMGPNTGVIGNEAVVELFDELKGCKVEVASKEAKKRYILHGGTWQPLPGGLRSAISTPLFSTGDKLRLLGEPLRGRGKDEHESLAGFVRRRMGQSFLDYAIDPFIKGIYAGDPEKLIVKYAMPKLYNLEQQYGSLIGGSVRKGLQKKTDLQKRVSREVFSCEGGLSSLIQSLDGAVGDDNLLLNCDNIAVMPREGGFTVTFYWKGQEIVIDTPVVITTTAAHALPRLLPFVDEADMSAISNLQYAPVVEVSVGFKHWSGMPLDGFGGLIPTKEKRDVLGVLFMSSLFAGRAPRGGALLSTFMGGVKQGNIATYSDNDIENIVANEFMQLMGCRDFNPDLLVISRQPQAIPQYEISSGARFDAVARIEQKYKGLVVAGNLRNGIGMADRILQAKTISREMC